MGNNVAEVSNVAVLRENGDIIERMDREAIKYVVYRGTVNERVDGQTENI